MFTVNDFRKAYTLMELALVLSIIGVIGAGVWIVFGDVQDTSRIAKVQEQTLLVVQNVRAYYGPRGVINPCPGNLTGTLDDNSRKLIPVEMRSDPNSDNSPINHVLGNVAVGNSNTGSFRVRCTGGGSSIEIRLRDLSKKACMNMLMTFPVLIPEIGVISMEGSGPTVAIDARNIANPGGGVSLPVSLANADLWCPNATGNEVRFGFRLLN